MKTHYLTVILFCGLVVAAQSPATAAPVGSTASFGAKSLDQKNVADNSGFKRQVVAEAPPPMPLTGTVAVQSKKTDAPSPDGLSVQNMKNTATYINRLQLVKSPSAISGAVRPSDRVYKDAVNTLAGVTSRIIESEQIRPLRDAELMEAASQIGSAESTKAAIEANSRLLVQTVQALHDLNKVLSGVLTSLQTQEERYVTQMSELSKMFRTDE